MIYYKRPKLIYFKNALILTDNPGHNYQEQAKYE